MTITRRRLVHLVGRAGGVGAAYRTMAAMGLLPTPAAYAGAPALMPGNGVRVAILGAGIAGMVAGYELGRAGYDCIVLEARERPGGRNWSLRAGDTVEETDSTQRVLWDEADHLYFNPGPARLPYHHQGILAYCRMLDVPVEVMCNDNRGALMQDDAAFAGKPQHNRAVVNDIRGYIAELAAKAVSQARMDQPVTTEDQERLRAFLRTFGALDQDLAYRGSFRSGPAEPPAAGLQDGKRAEPLDLRQLVTSAFWQGPSEFGEFWDQAATMMQPVGGMGRIGEAFGRRLGALIRYNSEVTELRRSGVGARIVVRDRRSGATSEVMADWVICTIPFPVLRGIPADFTPETQAALAAPDYVPAAKVAFQAERRFWELDEAIYGGISWTARDITQIWYPSHGLHRRKGILVGAYIWSDDIGNAFAAKSLPQRIDAAISDGERLHPQYRAHLGNGISVAWAKIPFNRGAWAEWSDEARRDAYARLLRGDGPFLFAGEHMSWITGWQEGAVRSAHVAIADLAARAKAARP